MTQQNKERLASFLAIFPGLLSIKEGGSVLLGITTKTYIVLPWLVWYNVLLGFIAVIIGIGIWKQRAWAARNAVTILTLHGLVLMILIILLAFKEPVAINSIMAMLFRTTLWSAIVFLLSRKTFVQDDIGT